MKMELKNFIINNFPQLFKNMKVIRGKVRSYLYKLLNSNKAIYKCPICKYSGPFMDYPESNHIIEATQCPKCGLYERHRLQYLTIIELAKKNDFSNKTILHFAPEQELESIFCNIFKKHETADLYKPGVDYTVDICNLPFDDCTFDIVFASHVLEHVKDYDKALKEVNRILKINGIAILPVPVVSSNTVEYSRPNQYEFGHQRAVGPDFIDNYKNYFRRVDVYDSTMFEEEYQLFTYEDRTNFPNELSPLRTPMLGYKHKDYVPICYK